MKRSKYFKRQSPVYNLIDCDFLDINKIGVYGIKSAKNNKWYVGSTIKHLGFIDRWRGHYSGLSKNKHHSNYLQNHVNKYGIDILKFTILEIITTPDIAADRELFWINELDSFNNGFNEVPKPITLLRGKDCKIFKDIDDKKVIDMYVNGKITINNIAPLFNVSESKITSVLKQNNISLINHLTALPLIDIQRRHFNGEKIEAIAKEFKVPSSTIRRQCIKEGIAYCYKDYKRELLQKDLPEIITYYRNGGSIVRYCESKKYSYDSVYRVFKKLNILKYEKI